MESTLVYIAIVVVVGGIIAYLINAAPFIEGTFKQIAVWLILAAVVLLVVMRLLAIV